MILSVKSATCTSEEPVSLSPLPYFATISSFFCLIQSHDDLLIGIYFLLSDRVTSIDLTGIGNAIIVQENKNRINVRNLKFEYSF